LIEIAGTKQSYRLQRAYSRDQSFRVKYPGDVASFLQRFSSHPIGFVIDHCPDILDPGCSDIIPRLRVHDQVPARLSELCTELIVVIDTLGEGVIGARLLMCIPE